MIHVSRNAKEGLLARWSRLKRESVADKDQPSAATLLEGEKARDADESGKQSVEPQRSGEPHSIHQRSEDVAPELPSIEELGPDSDYQAFMDPRVDDGVRRAALKTLFRDPAFNVTDGLDVYAADYTNLEKLTPAMVAALRYAQRNLFGEQAPSEQNTGAGGAGSVGDTRERVKAADEPLQSGETGSAAAAVPAADRAGSSGVDANAGDGDKQAGVRAGMADSDRTPRQQATEQSGDSGSRGSGTRCG